MAVRNKFKLKQKYGAWWDSRLSDIKIEISCIQEGGQWKDRAGNTCGLGLYEHYLNLQAFLWPELDDHRWHRLILGAITSNQITVLMGPASTAKTHEAAKFALCDYIIYPDETIVLVSSTDLRGLELRVWGEIKMLFKEAKKRYDWIPGHLIDSKHCISTDNINEDEVRDLRKGIVGIPCVVNNKFIGLGKYCFCPGTQVDTPQGHKNIESLNVGDTVLSAIGPGRVLATSCHYAPEIVRLHTRNGTIDCTPDHPFLTDLGWVNAVDISPHHEILSVNETMQIVREKLPAKRPKGSFLLSLLRSEMEDATTGNCAPHDSWERPESSRKGYQQGHFEQPERTASQEPDGQESAQKIQSHRLDWERVHRSSQTHQSRIHFTSHVPGVPAQRPYRNGQKRETRLCSPVQAGRVMAQNQAGCGTGWPISLEAGTSQKGPGKGLFFERTRVERVEIFKSGNGPGYCASKGGYRVHNIEVEGHPSYSVNGCVVHNCGIKQKRVRLVADEAQFMPASFLDAITNLDKNPDFKACIMGNPLDPMDSLGKASEPLDGWNSIGEPEKTTTWKTRFKNGICINLVGTDSPNFDFPETEPVRFPYLINRNSIATTVSFYGKDSLQYYSQCKGVMKSGVLARRVITREMCQKFRALESVIWKGTPTTKVYAADIAYGNIGGDRCIGMIGEFGMDIEDRLVLELQPPELIPVSVRNPLAPEDQIAEYVKTRCEDNGIPPENFFYDSTGRGSMGTAFARAWSANVNPVEFGGPPSTRVVCQDMFIFDEKTRQTRLKLCTEHYSKRVTEFWFCVRYCIESFQLRGLAPDVMEEGCMREWKIVRGDKIEIETKSETKERMGRSPDLFDCAAVVLEGALRRGFKIFKLAAVLPARNKDEFMERLRENAESLIRAHELTYR